jgi:hypothetical protein
MKDGNIEFIQIESQAGSECRLRNPWPDTTVTLYRNGNKAENLDGLLLTFPTVRGEIIIVIPVGAEPKKMKIL